MRFRVRHLCVRLPGGIAPHKEHSHDSGPLSFDDSFGRGPAYRDLPWRRTRDPYIIWLSEVMLQQTQVPRVETRMPAWLDRFPTVQALAQAAPSDVLDAWQGMGYNRRALALPQPLNALWKTGVGSFRVRRATWSPCLGIGPATAQGIRSFAFDLPGVYLETNVRTVFLHHFFSRRAGRSRSRAGAVDSGRLPGGSRCGGG